MPSIVKAPEAWNVLFGKSSTYGELNRAMAYVVTIMTVSEAIRRAPAMWVNTILFATAGGFAAAYATVYATEKLTTKRQAQELADWYADALTDPYAWHVETDRVVQGAVRTILNGMTIEGGTAPEIVSSWPAKISEFYFGTQYDEWIKVGTWL